MVCAGISFLLSGLLQIYVSSYPHDDCHGDTSIAWQLPQLFFISIAEAIVCVTGLEFAYSQAPPQYRQVGGGCQVADCSDVAKKQSGKVIVYTGTITA
jgi:dipeptide/tripeptide permease